MPFDVGFDNILGIKKQAALGTPIAVDKMIGFLSESLRRNPNVGISGAIIGRGYNHRTVTRPIAFDGEIVCFDDLSVRHPILEQFAGSYTVADPGPPAVEAYYQPVELDGSIWLTAALKSALEVLEFSDLEAGSLTLTGSPEDDCRISTSNFFRARINNSVINTSGSLEALAFPEPQLTFDKAELWLGDLVDELDSSDALTILSYQFAHNRNKEQRVAGLTPPRARENNIATVTLTITLPYLETTTWRTILDSQAPRQAQLRWDDGVNHRYLFMPLLKLMELNDTNTTGPEAKSPTLVFDVQADYYGVNTNPTMDFGTTDEVPWRMYEG